MRGSQGRLELQRVNLFEDHLQPLLELFLCAWFAFRTRELRVVCQRATVEIGSSIEQFDLRINVDSHCSILQDRAAFCAEKNLTRSHGTWRMSVMWNYPHLAVKAEKGGSY